MSGTGLLDTAELNTLVEAVGVNVGQIGDAVDSVITKLGEVKASNAAGQAALTASVAKLTQIRDHSQGIEDKLADAVNPATPPIVVEEPLPVVEPIPEPQP